LAKARPENSGEDERAEFLEKLDELEREAAAGLHEAPIDSVRRPMDMPEVLRDRPGAGGAPAHRRPVPHVDQNALAKVWAIGLDFGMMVLAGGGLGWLADRFLIKNGHWGILVGFVLGLVVGMFRFIREGLAANRTALADLKRHRDRNR
jgi:F0F1-type ATP synthase assembly protein I